MLVVPDGFRGTVRIEVNSVRFAATLPELGTPRPPPRVVATRVDTRPGAVTLDPATDFSAMSGAAPAGRFEDGTPLWRATPLSRVPGVAAWWVADVRPTGGRATAFVYAIDTWDEACREADRLARESPDVRVGWQWYDHVTAAAATRIERHPRDRPEPATRPAF